MFCPNGHRIQVQDRHRGRAGRCPQCKGLFIVPAPVAAEEAAQAAAADAAAVPSAGAAGGFRDWILDLHLHTVNPTKLKLKVGSLQGEYDTADAGFSETEILVATVYKGGGAFRAMQEAKKKAPVRQALLAHLSGGQPLDQLPALKHMLLTAAEIPQLKIVQPAAVDEESIFAGVAVFGQGRIAVRLPGTAGSIERQYLSFSLTEFREFSRLLARFGIENFGQELGIPLGDQFDELKCHYSDTRLHVIESVDYYRADPRFKVVLIGRRCAGCGLVVSEDARKKEKIGGASGSGIAKAICPKCKKKFGDISLFGIESADKTPAASGGAKA